MHISRNGAHAYDLCWRSYNGTLRRGFAHVALQMGSGFPIYPSFNENAEEMRFNPFFEVWTGLRLDIAYGKLMRSAPKPFRWAMWQLAFFAWISVCYLSVPIPVKVTGHVGQPVIVEAEDTVESLALKVKNSMENLIHEVRLML